jgi:hypothetical protein
MPMEHLVNVMGGEPDCIRGGTEARCSSGQRRFYTVRGKASHGLVTHLCPTVEMAIDTLKRFQREEVRDLSSFDPEGRPVSQADLEAIAVGNAL